MGEKFHSIDSFCDKNWSSGSDEDFPQLHAYRRRSKRTPAKRARRAMADSKDGSVSSDIFKNCTPLPSSTPNQPDLRNSKTLPNISASSASPNSQYYNMSFDDDENLLMDGSGINQGPSVALESIPVENTSVLETIDSRVLSPSKSNESIRLLKSLVQDAVISSSDVELSSVGAGAREKTTPRPKSDSFQSRMANAILDLDDSGNDGHADEEGSSDCIIEASTQPDALYSLGAGLEPLESHMTRKPIYDQTTELLEQRDIIDCDTDPPSSVEMDSPEPIDFSPTNSKETTSPELEPVKCEFPGDKSVANGQKEEEVLNLVDSCSIVDLCDSSIEIVGSSEQQPLPRLEPLKPLKNASKKRLMDLVLAGCKTFAPLPLTMDPLDSFINRYFALDPEAKDVFDQLLIPSLNNEFRWFRCPDESIASQLVDNKLFLCLDDQDDFFSRLVILLNLSELALLYSRLDPHRSFNTEAMRAHLLQDLSSCPLTKCANGFVQREATSLFAKRFVKMRPKALFAAKMALDILALPLNLYEKAFKHGDIARYLENLQADVDSGRTRLLNLAQGNCSNLISSETEFQTFAKSFGLKINIMFPKHLRPQLTGMQTLSELCAELAIVVCGSSFQVNENPIFAFQVANLVRALDEKIVFLHTDDDEVLQAKFLCLGLLLQQEVTQFGMKGLWAKRKMMYLGKLLGVQCEAQQLEDVLSQNVSPLELHVRTDFVAQVLSSKRRGLTAADKREIRAKLKNPSFNKTVLKIKWPTGDQKVNLKIISPYEEYYRKKYPNHVPNPGPLLMNAILLAFWPNIYHPMDDVFFSDFQTAPIDWGGRKFYDRREDFIAAQAAGFAEKGIDSLLDTIEDHIRRFSGHHCIVDWPLVKGRIREMRNLLKVLGLDKFLLISNYVLQKAIEREIAFPELAMWDHGMKLEFVGLKNPTDALYHHQFVWLEKLTEFGIQAHECQVTWMR